MRMCPEPLPTMSAAKTFRQLFQRVAMPGRQDQVRALLGEERRELHTEPARGASDQRPLPLDGIHRR
jgi:hypothetical protein